MFFSGLKLLIYVKEDFYIYSSKGEKVNGIGSSLSDCGSLISVQDKTVPVIHLVITLYGIAKDVSEMFHLVTLTLSLFKVT